MTVLIYQHNMDCIKTEPDRDAEVYSASSSVIQLVDIKQEEQPLLINLLPAKDDNDVSLSMCLLLMACSIEDQLAIYLVFVFKMLIFMYLACYI
jgi:hypothetical protein